MCSFFRNLLIFALGLNPAVAVAQSSLETNVTVNSPRLDFAIIDKLEVLLELPPRFVINDQAPSVFELRTKNGVFSKKSNLAIGSNSVSLGDISQFDELEGHAMIFYCEELELSRCFLKKPKIRLVDKPGAKGNEPLVITVLPH